MINRFRVVDDKKLKQIHNASLEILERTGMIVDNDRALALLADAGCKVDFIEKQVHFPPELVVNQTKIVPKQIVLAGHSPKQDMNPGNVTSFPVTRPTCGIERIIDYRTGEIRPATKKDLIEYAVLTDAMSNTDFCGVLSPIDVDLQSRDVTSAACVTRNTSKHVHVLAYTPQSVEYIAQIAQVIAGSREEARKRPPFSYFQAAISPLYLRENMIDCVLAAGKHGIPVFLNSSTILGATSPVTIAGGIALNNAEILGMNVILQLAYPGSAIVYKCALSAMDMKTSIGSFGRMEVSLASALSAQLGKEMYGFVTGTGGPNTDSKTSDVQSSMERTWASLIPVMAGVDIITGSGTMEAETTNYLTQMVIDDELFANIKQLVNGVQVNDDTLAVDVIDQVGPRGQFMDTDHTFEHFREALRPNDMFDHTFRENWEERGKPDIMDKARERVDQILKEHKVESLSDEQLEQIGEIEREAKIKLSDANG